MLCTLFVVPMTAMAEDGVTPVYNPGTVEVTSNTTGYGSDKHPKFANTLLIECDVTVPETVYNKEITRINTTDGKGNTGNIRLYLTTGSAGYGLYGAYVKYNTVNYYPIAVKGDSEFAGTYHVKMIFDAQKDVLLIYGTDGSISKVDGMSQANAERRITADNYVTSIEYKYPGEKITFGNIQINLLERNVTAAFSSNMTASSSIVNATFSDEISQDALNASIYTVLDSTGDVVNGTSVTATSTGANTASFAITGVSGSTDYTLSIDGLFADSGRTSDNALTYDFTTARVMADKNLYSATNKAIVATETLNAATGGYKNDAFGQTVAITGNVTIPANSTEVNGEIFHVQANNDGSSYGQLRLYLTTRNGVYGLYAGYVYSSTVLYYPIAAIDKTQNTTADIKIILDTEKHVLQVYNADGAVSGRTDMDKASAERRFDSRDFITEIKYTDRDVDVTYNNIRIDLIERGMTAELTPVMTSTASVVNATFSEEITQGALNAASYTVLNSAGTAVEGAVVTPTLVGTNGARFDITGVEGQTSYTLSVDNVFAKSGRTTEDALTCSFTTAKVMSDEVIYTKALAAAGADYDYAGKHTIKDKTFVIEADITVPEDALTASTVMETFFKDGTGNNPTIRIRLDTQSGKYGLYFSTVTNYTSGRKYYPIVLKEESESFAGTYHVKVAIDVQKQQIIFYDVDGNMYIHDITNQSDAIKFLESTGISYTSYTLPTGVSVNNVNYKLIERGLTADFTTNMTATTLGVNATFFEEITQDALAAAICKVLDSEGNEVAGITVTKELVGTNGASFTFTDVPGTYTLSIDKLYSTSSRTSDGAITYEFTIPVSKSVSVDGFTAVTPGASGVTSDITLKNIGEERTVWVVMAVYGNYNKLLGYDAKEVTVGSTPVTETFTTAEDCSSAKEVRVFVWNNENDMVPIDRNKLIWQAQ